MAGRDASGVKWAASGHMSQWWRWVVGQASTLAPPVYLGTPSEPHAAVRLPPHRAQGRAVSTRHSVAKVCAMIYKWEPTSDARVTLIAHGEPVCSTRDIRNSPSVRDGGRATPSGRTRGSYISYTKLSLRRQRKPIFNVSSQYSLLLLREIAERLEQELQGYANEFWTLLYQG